MLGDLAAAVGSSRAAALILTGEGRVFCAGADLAEVRGRRAGDRSGLGAAVGAPWRAHAGLTIAALNGTAAGGALGMVLACDLRLAVPGAEFFYPVMQLGVLPQPSDPARLAALVGPSRARLILLGGARIGAAEALGWGLIDRIVPPDALLAEAEALAGDALRAGPERVAAIRAMIG